MKTSGSTGISLAILCNALGYICHICLPDDTSLEKLQLLKSLGAELEPVKPASIVDPNQYTNAARRGALAVNQNRDGHSQRRAIFADQFEMILIGEFIMKLQDQSYYNKWVKIKSMYL